MWLISCFGIFDKLEGKVFRVAKKPGKTLNLTNKAKKSWIWEILK